MIRDINDLLVFKINYNISSELKFQELMEARKIKIEEEELPEYLLDESIGEIPSWESLENDSWALMRDFGFNWHLFVFWLECNIGAEGWDDCVSVLKAFENVILKKNEILKDLEEDSDEKQLLLIDYFDRCISRGLLYSYVKHEFPLIQYIDCQNKNKHSKLYDILHVVTSKDYENYRHIIEVSEELLKLFENLFKKYTIHCNKIKETLMKFSNILDIYEEHFIAVDDDINEDSENDENDSEEGKELENKGNIIYADTKDEAYKKIAEALEILNKVNKQDLAIPLLRKVMRWNSKNISEILHEINNKEGASYILTFMMD